MPKGMMNMAGVPKPPSPAKVQAKNRTNMPRKPKVDKLGDTSMKISKPGVLGSKKKRPATLKSKKPKKPKLNLPDPV